MKILYTILLFSLPVVAFSQAASAEIKLVDDRLYEVHDSAYIETLKTTNPVLLQRWSFYLDNAWYITDYPADKGKLDFPVVSIEDLENFNILQLEKEQHLQRDWSKRMKYMIKNTNKVLIYYSGEEFVRKLNTYLGRS